MTATASDIVARYASRWSIEVCFHDGKNITGDSQRGWFGNSVLRSASSIRDEITTLHPAHAMSWIAEVNKVRGRDEP